MKEAKNNVWYYLRECVRIYEQGGKPVRFRLDRGSCAMTWVFSNGIDYSSMQCRQSGKTVCALSLTSWCLFIAGEEFQVGMLAKDNSLREENVKRVKSLKENLPPWWIAEDKFKDKNNTTEIFYKALKTHYVTYVAQKDKGTADLQARGASPPMFHFDEFEYTVNNAISYPTILASTNTARANAKKNNKPHSNIITSTAGDPSKPECAAAVKILSQAMPFTELLYDVESSEKLHAIVKATSTNQMIAGTFSHLQLGFTNEWLRETITRNSNTRDQVMRDYLNMRVSIAEQPIIPKEVLATITASQCDPLYIQILSNNFVIYWYLPKEVVESAAFKAKPIIVGCDSSEMIGRDATTLVGVDPTDLSTAFTFRCNEGNINVVGAMVANLLMMFPAMVFVPENKSSGTSIIDSVTLLLSDRGHNPFKRMFNWVVNNKDQEEFARYDIRDPRLLDTSVKRFFGIKTDKSKRDELYSNILISAATKAASGVKDASLISELSSLTVRNGRVDHSAGGHDDDVVGWLLAMFFIFNAKHHEEYGIKPGTILRNVPVNFVSEKTRILAERQLKIRERIESVEDTLKYQKDPGLRRMLEHDLIVLRDMIVDGDIVTPQSADELNRDPRRFTDRKIAEASHPMVQEGEALGSINMLLNVRR
jgi:hypothetical protein